MKRKLSTIFKFISLVSVLILGVISIIGSTGGGGGSSAKDPVNPWTVTAIPATWLDTNPYPDKHDGGWVYSAREDVLYAMYGRDTGDTGQTLYRIDHIAETSEIATSWIYPRHGSHPVIDDTGTFIYMPPSFQTNQLERYNTVTDVRETLAPAPTYAPYSHGAWKDGKLWIVLANLLLYSYDPGTDTWTNTGNHLGDFANVATSGPDSNLIYIIRHPGLFYSYDVTTDTLTPLDSHPYNFILAGNGQFTWFGARTGFIYAADGAGFNPAIYDIDTSTWHALDDPRNGGSWNGHATYDSSRMRLYVTDDNSDVWYYEY